MQIDLTIIFKTPYMSNTDNLNRPILKLKISKSSDSDKDSKAKLTPKDEAQIKIKSDNVSAPQEGTRTELINSVPKSKKQLLAKSEYKEMLSYMEKHFPKAFPVNSVPLPLAIGIRNQIFNISDLPFSRMKIRKFFKIYTGKRTYLKELVVDNNRFNLDGTIASAITAEETNWLVWQESRNNKRSEQSNKASHDSFVKKVMESPVAASEFLEEFLPAEYKDILDLTTLKVEKESYVEDSLKTKLSDIVYSVKTKPDEVGKTDNTLIYTLVEHQSSPDYWIALRLWKYSLLLLERHTKKRNKLPVILPLVLYNGQKKYNVPMNLWELFSHPIMAKKAMADNYHLVDLNAMSDSDIDYEKHLSFVLYTLKHIHDRDTLKMLKQAMQKCTKALIIDKGEDYVHTKLILWYTDSKVPAENKQLLEQLIVDNLPKEDTDNIMRTIADTYIEEGINKGIAIGKNEGIAIGEARGKMDGINQRNIEIARRMLQENTDIKFIASVTGLSTDDILKIQNKM